MKKTVIIFIVAALILLTTGWWIISGSGKNQFFEIGSFGIIIIVVAFALFFGYKRLISYQKGEPAEDEMTKKVMQKASSVSFYISIYLWLVIMYFSDKIRLETHTLIGTGILGMAVVFALCWVVIYLRGITGE